MCHDNIREMRNIPKLKSKRYICIFVGVNLFESSIIINWICKIEHDTVERLPRKTNSYCQNEVEFNGEPRSPFDRLPSLPALTFKLKHLNLNSRREIVAESPSERGSNAVLLLSNTAHLRSNSLSFNQNNSTK